MNPHVQNDAFSLKKSAIITQKCTTAENYRYTDQNYSFVVIV